MASRLDNADASVRSLAAVHAVDRIQDQMGKILIRESQSSLLRTYGKRLSSDQQRLESKMATLAQSAGVSLQEVTQLGDAARKGFPDMDLIRRLPKDGGRDAGLLAIAKWQVEQGIQSLTAVLSEECKGGMRSLVGDELLALESDVVVGERLLHHAFRKDTTGSRVKAHEDEAVPSEDRARIRMGNEAH